MPADQTGRLLGGGKILAVMTHPQPEALDLARQRYVGSEIEVLPLYSGHEPAQIVGMCRVLHLPEFLDVDAMRNDYLTFAERWPRQTVWRGRTFEDMFRQHGGYSVWWTTGGSKRHPAVGVFPKLKAVWIFNRAMEMLSPPVVLIFTKDQDLAWALRSRCDRAGCQCEFMPGSSSPVRSPFRGGLRWLAKSLKTLFVAPVKMLVRATIARARAKTQGNTRQERQVPAIVYSTRNSSYIGTGHGIFTVWFWQEITNAVDRCGCQIRHRYLTHRWDFDGHRWISWWYHTAWPFMRYLKGAVPIKERYVAWRAWLASLPNQIRSIIRYYRLEHSTVFRNSFDFANADVSPFYVPLLRAGVAGISQWAQTVGSLVKSLKAIGNVKAMLVAEEMYSGAFPDIAAARELGIPTVGVQHGTIMPMNPIYTVPIGHVRGAPTPDYFCAFGEFAKETVSVHGHFPADRVWVTGSPRLDYLVSAPLAQASARKQLGLPLDKSVVLVATQTYPWFSEAVRAVFHAAKDRPECVVCVKTHPKRVALRPDAFARIADEVGTANVLYFTDKFPELLAACDILISGSSTTILEATLLGRSTISVNFSDEPHRYPYCEDGASVGARSPEELRYVLHGLLDGTISTTADRERFLRRHAGPTAEGKAADTLAARLLDLIARDDPACRPAVIPHALPCCAGTFDVIVKAGT